MWVGYHCDVGLFSRGLESWPQGERPLGRSKENEVCCWETSLLWPLCPARPYSTSGIAVLPLASPPRVTEVRDDKKSGQATSRSQSAGLLVADAEVRRVYCQDRPDFCVQPVERFCMIILCPVTTHPRGLARMMP